MDKHLKEIIENVEAALYSGEDITFNLLTLTIFKDILERWLKKVYENIKYLEKQMTKNQQ